MKKSLSPALISFLLISSIALASVSSQENASTDDADGPGDGENRGSSCVVRRELRCDAPGSCTNKLVHSFEKANGVTMEILREVAELLRELARQTLGAGNPEDAARTAMSAADVVLKEFLSNVSEAAGAGRDEVVEAAAKVGHKLRDAGQEVTPCQVMRLLLNVRFLAGLMGLLGYVTAYGMCVWVVFICRSVLARAIPKSQLLTAERVVCRVYWRTMGWCIGAAVVGHSLGLRRIVKFECYNLLACFAMVLVNLLYLEPRTTKVFLERMELEREELKELIVKGLPSSEFSGGDGKTTSEPPRPAPLADGCINDHPDSVNLTSKTDEEPMMIIRSEKVARLNARGKTLDSFSSILNIMVLLSLSWHLVYLGRHLQPGAC